MQYQSFRQSRAVGPNESGNATCAQLIGRAHVTTSSESSRGRTRTCDPAINRNHGRVGPQQLHREHHGSNRGELGQNLVVASKSVLKFRRGPEGW